MVITCSEYCSVSELAGFVPSLTQERAKVSVYKKTNGFHFRL